MSKEPFKSFIHKVGTFRGKKNATKQRQSLSDLKFYESNGDSSKKNNENSNYPHEDEQENRISSYSNAETIRSLVQPFNLAYLTEDQIFDQMTPEQIDEEFEKHVLNDVNLKLDKDIQKMKSLPLESKKKLLINMRKNEYFIDDKATNMVNVLKDALRNSKNLKENLKQLLKMLKRISICIASKPVSWLDEFNLSGGLTLLEDILLNYKTKFGSDSPNKHSNNTIRTNSTISDKYDSKEKDIHLRKNIRLESTKILTSFANTKYGINVILESKSMPMAIATCIDCHDTATMTVVCKLLAVLAVLDQEVVLNGITETARFTGTNNYFSQIVKALTIDDDQDLKISSMILINALICNADSLDFKIHLRSDFNRCGLALAIDSLKQKYGSLDDSMEKESDKLMKQ
ncbi:diaphanous -like protein, partial [Brachionus plicatilis]